MHQAEWKKYNAAHSRINLSGIRRMISRPNEQLPWQNQRHAQENTAHDDPAPENDDAPVQKKHYFGPAKFYCTETACYPCGVVLGWDLFDKAESPTNILRFLECIFPTAESRPSYICIDKGCQVFRTAVANGSAETTWKDTRFIVDTYHYTNHKRSDQLCQKWCNPNPVDNPNLVVPQRDNQGTLQYGRVFNTQASEQLNSWLASYHGILKRMIISNFKWYIHCLLYLHTKKVLKKQAKRAAKAVAQEIVVNDNESEGH